MRKKRVLAIVALALLFVLGACTAVVSVVPETGDLEVELKLSGQKDVVIIPNFRYVVTVKGDTITRTLSGNFPEPGVVTVLFKDLPVGNYTVEADIYYLDTFFSYASAQNVLVKPGKVKVKLVANPYF